LYPPHSFAAEKMRIVPDFLKSSILAPGWWTWAESGPGEWNTNKKPGWFCIQVVYTVPSAVAVKNVNVTPRSCQIQEIGCHPKEIQGNLLRIKNQWFYPNWYTLEVLPLTVKMTGNYGRSSET
jgi:hypothetical protein